MTIAIRIVKGRDTSISVPGASIEIAELVTDDMRLPLQSAGEIIKISETSISSVPVPRVAGSSYPCYIVINGDLRIPCEVVTNPERPLL